MILLDKLPAARITPRVFRFSEQLQARFVRAVDRTTTGDRVKLTEELTVRELEILRLAGQSMINREIAEHLHLSETTVKWYWRRILQKMAVQRRQQAIRAARDHGLLPRV